MSPAAALWSLLALSLSLLSTLVRAQGPVQSFFPASVPLAVRSPYMSTWAGSSNTAQPLSNLWPVFLGNGGIMGWAGKIRVDGTAYAWLGNDRIPANQSTVTNVQFTPTRSIYVMTAGPMNITITFLSPIEPDDWVKQSLPFSYVSIEANSLDGNTHSVQVYSDISAEWVSGNRSSLVKWNNQITGSSVYHEIELQNPAAYTEISNQAQDGKAYYAMASRPGLTWQIDGDKATRTQFANNGVLTNTQSTAFASISPVFSVFAISVDLGQISSITSPVVWAVGYVRDPVVQYTTSTGSTEIRRPYYATQYSSIGSAIDAFTADFSAAHDRAVALDQKIMSAAGQISTNYVDLVSLSAKQTMGALDITVLSDSSGNLDPTDVKIFMKDVGTSGRVNPVEKMYAAFPAYLYLNASLGGKMLAPLLEFQDNLSGQAYAAQDIGLNYPLATGTRGAHNQGIEQSGNMLVMMLAQARISGDGTLLSQHYNLTKRWADYLVSNSLTPSNQQTADGESNANMTNLAIKGIVGVKAMAEIARAVGQDFDASQYDSHASALLSAWQALAASSDQGHLLGEYDQQSSWALMYNIYADSLLKTGLVAQAVLDGQTQSYGSLLTQAPAFGLPIDSTSGQTSSMAWLLFTSATVTDQGVRNQLIQGAWARANSNTTSGALPDHYNDGTGSIQDGSAGPSLGAMFAHLALTVANTTIVVPASASTTAASGGGNGSNDTSSSSIVGPVVGGVVGGIAVVVIAAGAIFYFRRKRRYDRRRDSEKVDFMDSHQPSVQPFFTYGNQHTAGAGEPHDSYHGPSGSDYNPHTEMATAAAMGSASALVGGGAGTSLALGASAGLSNGSSTRLPPVNMHASNPSLAYTASTDPSTQSAAAAAAGLAYLDGAPVSAKARERMLNMQQARGHYYTPSLSASDATGSAALSSRDPLSPETQSAMGSVSPTDVIGLRAEVENLRRVMQEIRADRFEPPPEYA